MMHQLISDFLAVNRYCPLPGLGTLQLVKQPASTLPGGLQMRSPVQVVGFSARETNPDPFIQFVSSQHEINKEAATAALNDFCRQIKTLKQSSSQEIPCTGSFSAGTDGNLFFTRTEIPQSLMPAVALRKVIHPNRVHQIVVGDKVREAAFVAGEEEGVIAQMTARWWIWAAALALVGIGSLFFFHYTHKSASFSGNGTEIKPAASSSQYTLIK